MMGPKLDLLDINVDLCGFDFDPFCDKSGASLFYLLRFKDFISKYHVLGTPVATTTNALVVKGGPYGF